MIQDTSLEIFLKEVYPNLAARQRPVLHFLRNAGGDHTNAEIAQALARPINEITPRCLELRKLGLVLESSRRRCKVTGNTAKAWKAKYPVLPPAREEAKVEQTNSQLLGI
jgi:hypothetical protein